jgi:hypothetical protein
MVREGFLMSSKNVICMVNRTFPVICHQAFQDVSSDNSVLCFEIAYFFIRSWDLRQVLCVN